MISFDSSKYICNRYLFYKSQCQVRQPPSSSFVRAIKITTSERWERPTFANAARCQISFFRCPRRASSRDDIGHAHSPSATPTASPIACCRWHRRHLAAPFVTMASRHKAAEAPAETEYNTCNTAMQKPAWGTSNELSSGLRHKQWL